MFKNWNGLGIFTHNSKIKRINNRRGKYNVDCIAGCKTRVTWRFAEGEEQQHSSNLFMPKKQTRRVKGHNVTKTTYHDQWGGTSMQAIGRFSTYVIESGVDETGLER